MADKNFDQYEYVAIITPGATFLLGLTVIWPKYLHELGSDKGLSLGDLGIFLVLAYISGQILQSIAELVDHWFWWFLSGLPTDWIRNGNDRLLSTDQRNRVRDRVRTMTANAGWDWAVTEDACRGVTRQVYAKVSAAGRAGRIDAFNRTFGLMRGFVVALVALGITYWVVDAHKLWWYGIAAFAFGGVGAAAALFLRQRLCPRAFRPVSGAPRLVRPISRWPPARARQARG